jgi:hypothetical protein
MDKKLEDLIVRLFDEGKLLKEISAETGHSEGRISGVLLMRKRSAWNRRYPDAQDFDREKMIADYQDYMRIDDILAKHKISQTTLYRTLKETGTPTRPRRGTRGKANYQYKHGNGNNQKRRHPCLTKQVVALCVGHVVPRGWQLHHIDENPANNNPENIAVFPSKSTHAKFHQRQLRLQREGCPVNTSQLVSENGGFLLPSPTLPIVLPHEKGRLCPLEIQEMPGHNQGES